MKDDKEYLQKIIEIIQQKGEISMEALVTFFPQVSAEYLVNLCRKLLDEQKICYTDEGNVKGR